jgi:oligopeptide/dipeptide ABC transporter ATP-binding protein
VSSARAPLLRVEGLRVRLPTPNGFVTVVDGVDYTVERGQVFGVAGESGSGKTISALSLLRLLPEGAVVEGTATFDGQDLFSLDRRALRSVRGRELSMVFQDPMTSLHPMLTIGRQLTDHMLAHLKVSKTGARERAIKLLNDVRIPDPAGALRAYPHQFSGGMRQRIAIAIALACEPKLIIADEPTTALDVTVQAGIIGLLEQLREESGVSIILITHDLGVMSSIADVVSVFYAGRIIESGPVEDVVTRPRHPYTRGLIDSLPQTEDGSDQPLRPIPGVPATPAARPSGCAFHPRCGFAVDGCVAELPMLIPLVGGRWSACPVDPFAELTGAERSREEVTQ